MLFFGLFETMALCERSFLLGFGYMRMENVAAMSVTQSSIKTVGTWGRKPVVHSTVCPTAVLASHSNIP
jgi:hypothetical protein